MFDTMQTKSYFWLYQIINENPSPSDFVHLIKKNYNGVIPCFKSFGNLSQCRIKSCKNTFRRNLLNALIRAIRLVQNGLMTFWQLIGRIKILIDNIKLSLTHTRALLGVHLLF